MRKAVLSTLAALTLASALLAPAFAFADGSVRFLRSGSDPSMVMTDLNPQPLPPGRHGLTTAVCTTTGLGKRQGQPPEPCVQ